MKLENQQRKEEREHEMQMLCMILGNNSDISPIRSILDVYPYASVHQQNFGKVSSVSTTTFTVNEEKMYFQL